MMIQEPPKTAVQINMIGLIDFAHLASVYLRQGAKPGADKTFTFISSTAAVISAAATPISL